jgi:hypothetical protein
MKSETDWLCFLGSLPQAFPQEENQLDFFEFDSEGGFGSG